MNPPRFVSPQEFARLAGFSASTLWRRIRDGSIPFWQPGGPGTRVLIPLSAIESASPSATSVPAGDAAATDCPAQKPIPGPRPRWQTRTPNIEEI